MPCGMELLRERRGTLAEVARKLGLTRAAVGKWVKVPAEHVVAVETITGIPREALRPELYIRIPSGYRLIPDPEATE